MDWFDAHIDLAYLAVNGRDLSATRWDCGGPHPPAAVTLAELKLAGVRCVLGTIFTEPDATGPEGYPAHDAEAAHRAGLRQLAWYHDQWNAGTLRRMTRENDDEARPGEAPIRLGILMENADPIRRPDEVAWWAEQGVLAIGMAWAKPSRYAGGNSSAHGLTDLGRDLVQAIDAAGLIHDLAHLSQPAAEELLALTTRPIMASHSNCRALLGGDAAGNWQRHLSDGTIREIGRRGGMIGLNLYERFLRPMAIAERGSEPRGTLESALDHVEHACAVMGHRQGVGLGSDMDGGFGADELCEGIDSPADLIRLADGLRRRGWNAAEIAGFTHLNWLNFLGKRGAKANNCS